MSRAEGAPRWRRVLRRVRRIWVTSGALALLLMPVYAWWVYAPRLPPHTGSRTIEVRTERGDLDISPTGNARAARLIWLAGCLVPAEAYLPLARDVASQGYRVTLVALPWRCAPTAALRAGVIRRVRAMIDAEPGVPWVLGGHSKGAVLACDVGATSPAALRGLLLAGTTHPRDVDLSETQLAVTKVVATRDRVAPLATSEARRALLPASTVWVRIAGGNHSQFGWYGWQVGDGRAELSHADQQRQLSAAALELLRRVSPGAD